MKSMKKSIVLFLIFCGVLLAASQAFCAATGFEDDAGGPQGLAIQGSAPGAKLAGVVFIESYNQYSVDCPGECVNYSDIRAVVRLRKAGNIQTLYTEILDVPTGDAKIVQMAIMGALENEIKEKFFDNDQNVVLALRTAEEFGSIDIERGEELLPVSYIIADIVIAGK